MNVISKKVVIIDDDNNNIQIVNIVLKQLCRPVIPQITYFLRPAEGVAFLSDFLLSNSDPVVLFLDLNMPILMGWDVLDRLSLLPGYAKEKLTVYMLSSSIDPADAQRAIANELVTKFIPKPLTMGMSWVKDAIIETAAV